MADLAEGGVHKRQCSPESGMPLMTGDPCFGIFLSGKCKVVGRVHCRAVLLSHKNSSDSGGENGRKR